MQCDVQWMSREGDFVPPQSGRKDEGSWGIVHMADDMRLRMAVRLC